MEYAFHFNNSMAETGLYMALKKCLGVLERPPVVLCIGSDLAVGDSLGPDCRHHAAPPRLQRICLRDSEKSGDRKGGEIPRCWPI